MIHRKKGGMASSKMFLEFLENFIKTEKQFVRKDSTLEKLVIYRQAFDYFIQEFKTYSAVLSEIKNGYEMSILELEESKRLLEPLKGKLAILKLQNLQELNKQSNDLDEFLEKFRIENQNLREESLTLTEKIQVQKQEISSLVQENLVLKEKNEIKVKVETSKVDGLSIKEIQQKDLEIAKLQEQVTNANMKISDLSRDLQGLMENNDDLITPDKLYAEMKKTEDLNRKNLEIQEEITLLNTKIEDLHKENEDNAKKTVLLESFKFPDWQYIQYQVPYSIREYEVSCKKLNCNDVIVMILLEILKIKTEVGSVKNSHIELSSRVLSKSSVEVKRSLNVLDDYWSDSKALGIELPKFLNFKGRLRNRNISRVQVLEFVLNVFNGKKGFDKLPKNKGKQLELSEFFFLYLKKRFGSKDILVEWGVNILYYSNQYGSSTALLSTFYKVVVGIWDISVYNYLDSILEKVKFLFSEADLEFHRGVAYGTVENSSFFNYLKSTIWLKKSKINLQSLEDALNETNTEELFSNDSSFVNMIFLQEIEASRNSLLTVTSSLRGDSISYMAALDLLSKVYSTKSSEEIQKIIMAASGKEKMKDNEQILKADLLKTLSRYL